MNGMIQKNMFNHGVELKRMRSAMPPEMQRTFDRIVLAGQKILYSKETQPMVDQILNADIPMANKLGEGVANIVVMIDNKANGAIPKEVIIPAATVLLFDAADFLKRTGEKITAEDIGKAYELMFYGIYEAYGVQPKQLDSILEKMGSQGKTKEA